MIPVEEADSIYKKILPFFPHKLENVQHIKHFQHILRVILTSQMMTQPKQMDSDSWDFRKRVVDASVGDLSIIIQISQKDKKTFTVHVTYIGEKHYWYHQDDMYEVKNRWWNRLLRRYQDIITLTDIYQEIIKDLE